MRITYTAELECLQTLQSLADLQTHWVSHSLLIWTAHLDVLSAFQMRSGCRPLAIHFQREAGGYFGLAVLID